jgi:transcriptional regulator with XRE-family HTH domain
MAAPRNAGPPALRLEWWLWSMRIGDAIKLVRTGKGLKQRVVAEGAGVSLGYLSLLERNQRDPTLTTLLAICDALDTSPVLVTLLAEQNHPMLQSVRGEALSTLLAGF